MQVAKADRLGGPEGHDFEPLLASMRLALAALAVGMSRAALDYAIDYAKDREVFGVKVAQKQAIAFMLAEMATEIEAIRLLTWEAAWMLDTGKPEACKAGLPGADRRNGYGDDGHRPRCAGPGRAWLHP